MRILIDECIPRKFKNGLAEHECKTVPEAGFSGKKNGELLSLAEEQGFQVFVTMDKGIEFEQNLAGRRIGVLILRAASNRLADLLPLTQACLKSIPSIKPGQIVNV
jgi:predicted nuclease of predicted toxin-antitoxin system